MTIKIAPKKIKCNLIRIFLKNLMVRNLDWNGALGSWENLKKKYFTKILLGKLVKKWL